MKRIISALALCIALSSPAAALSIPTEQISGSLRSGQFSWRYSYDLSVINDAIHVDIDYAFMGPMSDLLWNRWEKGIESIWSTNRFSVPILFNVDRVDIASPYDYLIKVQAGSGRADVTHWYVTSTGRTAAHEFGHQISLWDEYVGGATNPDNPIISYDGVMGYGYLALDRYYEEILSWYDSRVGDYGEEDPAPVPEPSTWLMLAIGLAGVGWMKKRQAA